MFGSLFKTRPPKRFELRTRYYNAEKEAMEQRIRKTIQSGSAGTAVRMRQQFNERRKLKAVAGRQASVRMILIAVVLMMVIWYVFS